MSPKGRCYFKASTPYVELGAFVHYWDSRAKATSIMSLFLLKMANLSTINVHSKLRSITPVATKVHVVLRSFVVLAWMRDTIELA